MSGAFAQRNSRVQLADPLFVVRSADSASPDDPNEISFAKGEILDIVDNSGKWYVADPRSASPVLSLLTFCATTGGKLAKPTELEESSPQTTWVSLAVARSEFVTYQLYHPSVLT